VSLFFQNSINLSFHSKQLIHHVLNTLHSERAICCCWQGSRRAAIYSVTTCCRRADATICVFHLKLYRGSRQTV
jgi:hypothetical protein